MAAPTLILASTSRYRHELLSRLRLPFEVRAPEVDETPRPGEAPAALALRLALAKARAVANALAPRHADALVIGSDQVADLDGAPIGKPGTHERAVAQLRAMRGRSVVFQTAVAVVRAATGFEGSALVPVTVRFRPLSDAEIEHYLRTEQPYDCAGSAKCETLGIALLDAIASDDPTALVGLPLIRTSALLRAAGLDALQPQGSAGVSDSVSASASSSAPSSPSAGASAGVAAGVSPGPAFTAAPARGPAA
jgi:septum formation protein